MEITSLYILKVDNSDAIYCISQFNAICAFAEAFKQKHSGFTEMNVKNKIAEFTFTDYTTYTAFTKAVGIIIELINS